MFLEMATTAGAVCAAFLKGCWPQRLFVIFGIVLLFSVAPQLFNWARNFPKTSNDVWQHTQFAAPITMKPGTGWPTS